LQNIFDRGCPGGGLYVDVGANSGFYVSIALVAGCRVVAFEPQPQLRSLILANAARLGASHLLRLYQAGGERRQLLHLVPHQFDAQSSVAADGTGVAVDVATLDDVLVNERHIVALKIDVEGAGASVVRGARRVFSECKIDHLFMEDTQTAQALTETDAFHLGRFHKLIAFREVYEAENDIVQSEFHNNMTALYEVVRSGDVRGDEYFEDFTHRPIQTKTAMWQDFWLRGDDDARIDHQRPWLLQQE